MEWHYICTECGRTYEIRPEIMICTHCCRHQEPGKPLRGILEALADRWDYDPDQPPTKFLPVESRHLPPIPVGDTPLWAPPRLRRRLQLPGLFLKDDTRQPTGSLKDRASLLVAGLARRHAIGEVVVASTGNAASSMAGIGAAAGLTVTILVPETAPPAKIVQALQYGARVHLVAGTYDQAYDMSLDYSRRTNALNRNTAYNPLTIEGKKTVALEIFRQLNGVPDTVFLSAGDAVILAGVYKGFADLQRCGLTQSMPHVVAVQAAGSSALYRAWQQGGFGAAQSARTLADSIAVEIPRNGYYALQLLHRHRGECLTVSDDEILAAQHILAAESGLFAEPSAAAALAGLLRCRDRLPADQRVVVLITGSGLKDIAAARKGITMPTGAIQRVEDIL
ncbi:MAG: pyridoxal-phosphate dependent enzyme [Acidobacteria bacterium]|nr:pyridoxal-phosphate dependent enzyme [Acidobacteriota bacterium]